MTTRWLSPSPAARLRASPKTERTLRTSADGWRFPQHSDTPIYFINASAFNLLGAEAWINNLTFVNSTDSFDGRHPNVFIAGRNRPAGLDLLATTNYLLRQPEVADFFRERRPGGKVLFLMMDEETEHLAHRLGLEVCLPLASVRERLDSKVTATRLATAVGVASVPHVLAGVPSYAALRRVAAHLGPDLVVQLPHGDSGETTFFVSTAEDFNHHAQEIAAASEVKVMRRLRCRPATLEACVTRHGTLVGPLLTELTGCPDLTPYRGGWCGNELAADAFSLEVRRQAQQAALALGAALRRENYRGCFGLDFLLDQDSGALYLGELNPRLTGATPLTSQAALDRGLPPLLLCHLAQWLGIDTPLDVHEFNNTWLETKASAGWARLILDHLGPSRAVVTGAPRSGIWRLGEDGAVSFVHPGWSLQRGCQHLDGDDALQLGVAGAQDDPSRRDSLPGEAMTELELFLEVLDREPAEQPAYLDGACGGDAALRRRIEALLRSYTGGGGFLAVPAAEQLAAAEHAAANATLDLSFLAPTSEPGLLGRLDHYEVLEVVGKGGMGVVLRARDTKLERVVAIKVLAAPLAASDSARQRFAREARATAAIRDEHVVAIYAVRDDAPVPYLVMEFIDGCNLDALLRRGVPLEVKEVLRIGMQVASGLAAAHQRGLIHRDVKPGNILLEDRVQRVKLTDFGLARAADDVRLTQSGLIAGTPLYMAPEQAAGGQIDARADLFSLGSVLYELCTGQPAFEAATTVAVIRRVCDETPQPIREINPDIPEPLCRLIDRLHAKRPADRPASAKEVADDLRQFLAEQTVGGIPTRIAAEALSLAKIHGQRVSSAAPNRYRHWVYLATTTSDVDDERDRIKRELLERGHVVLPDAPLPTLARDVETVVANYLAKCTVAIHLLGKRYGVTPEDSSESIPAMQVRLTADRAIASDLERLIWMPGGGELDDARQRAFVLRVQEDPVLHRRAEIIEGNLNLLKKDLIRRLAPPEEKPKATAPVKSPNGTPKLYLICDPKDEAAVEALEDYLFAQGLEILLPAFDGDDAVAAALHHDNLLTCNAVLVYYGRAPRAWVDIKLRELLKAAGYGRAAPIAVQAVYIAPPDDRRKDRFHSHQSAVIRQPGAFTPGAELDRFVSRIKEVSASATFWDLREIALLRSEAEALVGSGKEEPKK